MHPEWGHMRAGELVPTLVLRVMAPEELGPQAVEVREVAVCVPSS